MRALSRWELKRRDFLRALGAGAGLLPLLQESRSFAVPSSSPKRFIVMTKANAARAESFWPTWSGGRPADGSLTSASLPLGTEPLTPFKDKLLFTDGIALRNWLMSEGNPTGDSGNAHHNWGSLLTGRLPADRLLTAGGCRQNENPAGCRMQGGGKSIDVAIGEELMKQDPNLIMPSLSIGVRGGRNGDGMTTPSWFGPDQPNSHENDPYKVFNSVFGGKLPTAGASSGPDPRALEELKLLDFVGRDLERFSAKLGSEDRMAIQSHLSAVQMRKDQLVQLSRGSSVVCEKPGLEANVALSEGNAGKISNIMLDLAVDAMKCNLARSVNFVTFDTNSYDIYFTWLKNRNPNFSDDQNPSNKVSEFPLLHFHSLAHGSGSGLGQTLYDEANRWHIGQLAYLMARLQSEPEGAGTMLDNTLILWADSLSTGGGHSVFRMPWLLAGNAGGYFRSGRHVQLGKDVATNGLFVSIANAMGTPPAGQVYGDPKFGSGEYEQLRA